MKNIIYFSPRINKPIGGVKVIHNHSQLINDNICNSQIYYMYGNDEKIDWFLHNVNIKSDSVFNPSTDFVILPESQIFHFWKELVNLNVPYAIFVQNGYLINKGIAENEIQPAYDNAKLIICISNDAMRCISLFFPKNKHKIFRATYSIDENKFRSEKKRKIITYMPRKMTEHSNLVIFNLKKMLPVEWEIIPLHGMNEAEVADNLSRSMLFLAFCDFEGLPIPPVEAAFSGNYIIGYTGQGGAEYWNPPTFQTIATGDIVDFIEKVMYRVYEIDKHGFSGNEKNNLILRRNFSKDTEIDLLKNIVNAINEI